MKAIRSVALRNLFNTPPISFPVVGPMDRCFSSESRRMLQAKLAPQGMGKEKKYLAASNHGSADSCHDLEVLHRFTSGRWLWREPQQLACRYVKFDMPKLLELAASAIGSKSCTEVVKVSEGQHNKVFQFTMSDGRQAIAKLPNPNAGRPHFTTASEVATLDFVQASFPFLLSPHILIGDVD